MASSFFMASSLFMASLDIVFLLHGVAHLVLSEGGGGEGKAERESKRRKGRGRYGSWWSWLSDPLGWVGFLKATSAALPTTMPRPALLPASPTLLPLSRSLETGGLKATRDKLPPKLGRIVDGVLLRSRFCVCAAACRASLRGQQTALKSGLSVRTCGRAPPRPNPAPRTIRLEHSRAKTG